MDFKEPFVVYTAETNLESHLVVELLANNGIEALAVEDQSGVSLWSFGTLSQFHKPKIWVEKSNSERSISILQDFEEKKRQRSKANSNGGEITAVCEECGTETLFAKEFDGTTQDCPHCHSYIDVGDLPWQDDFGEPDD